VVARVGSRKNISGTTGEKEMEVMRKRVSNYFSETLDVFSIPKMRDEI